MRLLLLIFLTVLVGGCLGYPAGVAPVADFKLPSYLGKWYEIARLDHSFERGLSNVTAEYSLRDDGGVRVVNRGFSAGEKSWKQAEGTARFVRSKNEGYLKVSFFGPFYSSYVLFELDEEYQYAFVTGYNQSYLWLLARTPTVDSGLIDCFIDKAKQLGFDTDELIFVKHDRPAL